MSCSQPPKAEKLESGQPFSHVVRISFPILTGFAGAISAPQPRRGNVNVARLLGRLETSIGKPAVSSEPMPAAPSLPQASTHHNSFLLSESPSVENLESDQGACQSEEFLVSRPSSTLTIPEWIWSEIPDGANMTQSERYMQQIQPFPPSPNGCSNRYTLVSWLNEFGPPRESTPEPLAVDETPENSWRQAFYYEITPTNSPPPSVQSSTELSGLQQPFWLDTVGLQSPSPATEIPTSVLLDLGRSATCTPEPQYGPPGMITPYRQEIARRLERLSQGEQIRIIMTCVGSHRFRDWDGELKRAEMELWYTELDDEDRLWVERLDMLDEYIEKCLIYLDEQQNLLSAWILEVLDMALLRPSWTVCQDIACRVLDFNASRDNEATFRFATYTAIYGNIKLLIDGLHKPIDAVLCQSLSIILKILTKSNALQANRNGLAWTQVDMKRWYFELNPPIVDELHAFLDNADHYPAFQWDDFHDRNFQWMSSMESLLICDDRIAEIIEEVAETHRAIYD